MATTVETDFGEGAANITKEHGGQATVGDALRAAVDDMAELRTQFVALLAKLDLDATVTDTDYESTLAPAAATLVKG